MPKIRTVSNEPTYFLFWCPACDAPHQITTRIWTFNGDLERPTIRNSVLVNKDLSAPVPRCHSFVTDGLISFENDCTHEMNSVKDVPLPDYPDNW